MTSKAELVDGSGRGAVGLLSTAVAVVALTYVVAWKPLPIAMPFFARVLLFGTPVVAVALAWLVQLGTATRLKSLEDLRRTVAKGAGIAGAAPALFVVVPACFFGTDSSLYAWATTGAAVIVCAVRADRHRGAAGVHGTSDQLRAVAVAPLGVVCAAIAIYYVMVGLASKGIQDNDGAYYFGMARHIARTGRIDEPIVWNFLAAPEQLVHSAFDYWQGLAALVLVPPMVVFGPSHRVALVSTAVISAMSVFLFAYVVGRAHPIRNPLLRFTLVGVFAFSEAMQIYRFEPETVALAQALLLGALAAFAVGRYRTAIVVAFLLYLTRADCVLLSLVVASACLVRLIKDRNALRAFLLLSAGLIGVYLARNLLAWGTVMPPGASRAPFLLSYLDLYAYGVDYPGFGSASSRIFEPKYVIDKFTVGGRTLLDTPLVPGRVVWYLLGIAGGLAWLRRGRSFELTVWVLAFPTVGALAWAAGTVFAPYRTLHTLLPVIVLAGGYTLDNIVGSRAIPPGGSHAVS